MWPPEKPLTLPKAGTLLSDSTPEEYEAVVEDRRRWTDVHNWHKSVLAGKTTKAAVWGRIKDSPEAYRDDMVRRLRELDNQGRRCA